VSTGLAHWVVGWLIGVVGCLVCWLRDLQVLLMLLACLRGCLVVAYVLLS
jgi:hypothetical protein